MPVVKSIILAIAGTASAILLGCCVYFDHKRRMDPEYRRKVHDRREQAKVKEQMQSKAMTEGCVCACGYCCGGTSNVLGRSMANGSKATGKADVTDQAEHYFSNEIKTGENLIRLGRLDEGLTHMANAIELCAYPEALLQMIQASLPEEIYRPLLLKLQEHGRRPSESSELSEILTNEDDDSQGTSDTSLPMPILHAL